MIIYIFTTFDERGQTPQSLRIVPSRNCRTFEVYRWPYSGFRAFFDVPLSFEGAGSRMRIGLGRPFLVVDAMWYMEAREARKEFLGDGCLLNRDTEAGPGHATRLS